MGFADSFLRGLQAGQQYKQQQQAQADAAEDRKIRKMLLDQEMRKLKIEEAIQKRELSRQNVSILEGTPEADLTPQMTEGGVLPSKPTPGVVPQGVQAPTRIAPMTIPGVPELGVPDIQKRPRTMAELLQARRTEELSKPVKLGPGETLSVPATGEVLARGGAREPGSDFGRHLAGVEAELGRPLTREERIGEFQQWSSAGRQTDPELQELNRLLRQAQIDNLRARTEQTTPPTESMDAVAEMVIGNPDLLKNFTPTQRGKILTHIATTQNGALANKRLEAVNTMVAAAKDTLQNLGLQPDGIFKAPSGFRGAIGAKGPSSLFGFKDEPIAGTSAATYARYVDTLKSQLTLPRLEYLRGLGHMSDREFKAIADSVSALDRSMSEKAFVKELKNIMRQMQTIEDRAKKVPRSLTGPASGASRRIVYDENGDPISEG